MCIFQSKGAVLKTNPLSPLWIGAWIALFLMLLSCSSEPVSAPVIAPSVASTPSWKGDLSFEHPEADFTFRYPGTWVVTETYIYETPAGARAEHLTVILQSRGNLNPTDRIMVNPPQPACEVATCVERGSHWLVTYSDSADVLSVFKVIVASFHEIR